MFADELKARLAGLVDLDQAQIEKLEEHYRLLVRWNPRINLTSVADLQGAVERHYCESLFLASHVPPGPLRIADLGSGAGFPGFPVAVLRPDCNVTLIEAHQRKAVFLREASRKLGNVRVLALRADAVKEEFDQVISRAVSYRDLTPALKELGKNADLLTGAEIPPEEVGFVWESVVALPWGKQRYLRIGRRAE